jgi:hypothetical protein
VTDLAAICCPSTKAATTVPSAAGKPFTVAEPKNAWGITLCADTTEGNINSTATMVTAKIYLGWVMFLRFIFNLWRLGSESSGNPISIFQIFNEIELAIF